MADDDAQIESVWASIAEIGGQIKALAEDVGASTDWRVRELQSHIEEIYRRLVRVSDEATGSSETCTTESADTVGGSTEGSEAAETATWASGDGPVDVWMACRVGYFHAGDEKLYGYARKLSFNSCGKLIAVSAETRYEIDAPVT